MELQPVLIAAVSTLSGVLGKAAFEHLVQLLSPTARLKKAEAEAKKHAPPPSASPLQFVLPIDLVTQAKQLEVLQLREELSIVQGALRRVRLENEELSMGRAHAQAVAQQLQETQASLHTLRATTDAQAQELAALSAQLSLERAHNLRLVSESQRLRAEGPPVLTRPERVLPEFKAERVRTRGGSVTPQQREKIRKEGESHG